METLVSIIIPIYNVEDYLKECIDSVISQTYKRLEIILVDDGSTDASGRICEEYGRKDNRILVVHQKNQGPSIARNNGLEISKGDYIAFVDGDDWLEPNYIERMLTYVSPDTIVACGIFKDKSKTHSISKVYYFTQDDALDLFFGNDDKFYLIHVVAWNKLYPRSVFDNLRYPEYMLHEDVYVILDVLYSVSNFIVLEDGLYHYRIRNNSITQSYTSKNFEDWNRAIDHHKTLIKDDQYRLKRLACMRLELYYFELSKYYLGRVSLEDERILFLSKAIKDLLCKLHKIPNDIKIKSYLLVYAPFLFVFIYKFRGDFLTRILKWLR